MKNYKPAAVVRSAEGRPSGVRVPGASAAMEALAASAASMHKSMTRVPEWDDPRDPWRDLYAPRPADPPWPEATVTEKDPPQVLYGPKGHPLPPSRQPDGFGFQPKGGAR